MSYSEAFNGNLLILDTAGGLHEMLGFTGQRRLLLSLGSGVRVVAWHQRRLYYVKGSELWSVPVIDTEDTPSKVRDLPTSWVVTDMASDGDRLLASANDVIYDALTDAEVARLPDFEPDGDWCITYEGGMLCVLECSTLRTFKVVDEGMWQETTTLRHGAHSLDSGPPGYLITAGSTRLQDPQTGELSKDARRHVIQIREVGDPWLCPVTFSIPEMAVERAVWAPELPSWIGGGDGSAEHPYRLTRLDEDIYRSIVGLVSEGVCMNGERGTHFRFNSGVERRVSLIVSPGDAFYRIAPVDDLKCDTEYGGGVDEYTAAVSMVGGTFVVWRYGITDTHTNIDDLALVIQ